MITKFQGHSLKIQHWSSFDLNNNTCKYFQIASNQCKSSKYWWNVWILGRGHKNQTSSEVRSVFMIEHLLIKIHFSTGVDNWNAKPEVILHYFKLCWNKETFFSSINFTHYIWFSGYEWCDFQCMSVVKKFNCWSSNTILDCWVWFLTEPSAVVL